MSDVLIGTIRLLLKQDIVALLLDIIYKPRCHYVAVKNVPKM